VSESGANVQQAYGFSFPEDRLRAHQRPLAELFSGRHSVLDIGCGRGVMLDLLRDRGVGAEGIDIMPDAVTYCRGKGHTVHLAEATEFLANAVSQYDGILGSHVVEHLDFESATRLLGLCFTALRPGGVLVVVTPNPRDLSVLSDVFWLDPTHRRPYPPELVASMLKSSGYAAITIRTPLGRPSRRRDWAAWLLHKLVLGRYYGNPETIAVGRKPDQVGNPAILSAVTD
jgi:2-polyprenyl-3-methyl-5-hydroxy-6-metoxy-1,4-benzoquinol methylase